MGWDLSLRSCQRRSDKFRPQMRSSLVAQCLRRHLCGCLPGWLAKSRSPHQRRIRVPEGSAYHIKPKFRFRGSFFLLPMAASPHPPPATWDLRLQATDRTMHAFFIFERIRNGNGLDPHLHGLVTTVARNSNVRTYVKLVGGGRQIRIPAIIAYGLCTTSAEIVIMISLSESGSTPVLPRKKTTNRNARNFEITTSGEGGCALCADAARYYKHCVDAEPKYRDSSSASQIA